MYSIKATLLNNDKSVSVIDNNICQAMRSKLPSISLIRLEQSKTIRASTSAMIVTTQLPSSPKELFSILKKFPIQADKDDLPIQANKDESITMKLTDKWRHEQAPPQLVFLYNKKEENPKRLEKFYNFLGDGLYR